jgi:hypothetical protein
MTWRDIKTDPPPKDGTEFQGWVVGKHWKGWEPRCRFNSEDDCLQLWERIDYDEEGWVDQYKFILTHWMPRPSEPPPTEPQP